MTSSEELATKTPSTPHNPEPPDSPVQGLNQAELLKEREEITRNIKLFQLRERLFLRRPLPQTVEYRQLHAASFVNKSQEERDIDHNKKVEKFRSELKRQYEQKQREKERLLNSAALREEQLNEKIKKEVEEMNREFETEHAYEKPGVSKLRNPQAHREYERHLKQRNEAKKFNKAFKIDFFKDDQNDPTEEEKFVTEVMMQSDITKEFKTDIDYDKRNRGDDDILDRLMRAERKKEQDFLVDSAGYVAENEMEEDFNKRMAVIGDYDQLKRYSSYKENLNRIDGLISLQKEKGGFSCEDLIEELNLGQPVTYPPKGFGEVHCLDKFYTRKDHSAKRFGDELAMKSVNSSRMFADDMLRFEGLL